MIGFNVEKVKRLIGSQFLNSYTIFTKKIALKEGEELAKKLEKQKAGTTTISI